MTVVSPLTNMDDDPTALLQAALPAWWAQGWLGLLVALAVASFCFTTSAMGVFSGVLVGVWLASIGLVRWRCGAWVVPPWQPMDSWVALLWLAAVVATGWSSVQPDSVVGLVKLTLLMSLYPMARWLWWAYPHVWRWQLGVWFVLGLVQVLAGWGQLTGFWSAISGPLATWQDPNLDASLRMTRIVGTVPPFNPNLLAGAIIPLVGLALGWAVLTRLQALSQPVGQVWQAFKAHWLWLLISGVTAIALVWALVMTGSRGGFLALVAMAGALYLILGHVLWRHPQCRQWAHGNRIRLGWLVLGGLALVGVGGVLAASPSLWARVQSIVTGDSSTAYRMQVYRSAFQMIQDNWLWGIGPGNRTFQDVYGLYQVPNINALAAYSVPLEIWIETGVLGIVAFVGMVVAMLWQGFIRVDNATTPWALNWQHGVVLAALVGALVYGLFDTVWYRPTVNIMFWLLLAGWVSQPYARGGKKAAPSGNLSLSDRAAVVKAVTE